MLKTTARIITASLLIVSAAAFVAGATMERNSAGRESHPEVAHTGAVETTEATPTTSLSSAPSAPASTPSRATPTPKPTPSTKATGGDGDGGETATKSAAAPTVTSPPSPPPPTAAASDADGGESPTATAGANVFESPHSEAGEKPAHSTEASSETLLGLNPEAPALVALAAIMSVVFAVLILTVPFRGVGVVIAAAMLVFTALDIREVVHQLNESRTGLALWAALVAGLHLTTAVAALATTHSSPPATVDASP